MKVVSFLFALALASVAVIAAPTPGEGFAAEVGSPVEAMNLEARNPEPEPEPEPEPARKRWCQRPGQPC